MWRDFAERILRPLFDYLDERVGEESSVLYALERYVRRVEWFDREDLYGRAMARPRKAEEVYDADLRRFLFAEGINMPFSQAKSPSGSLTCSPSSTPTTRSSAKSRSYGAGRGKRHLAGGVNQAIAYASDYGKQVAYLVSSISPAGHSACPRRRPQSSGRPASPSPAPASTSSRPRAASRERQQAGQASPRHITHDDLVDPDATD